MRVSFVMATASRIAFGIFPIVVGSTRALQRRGHQPLVVATRDEFTSLDRAAWGGVPIDTLRSVHPKRLYLAPAAPLYFRRHSGFDIMSIQGVWACLFDSAVAQARREHAPIVLTPHGMLEPWALRLSRWKKRIAEWAYVDRMLRAVDCFHVNSEAEARSIRELGFKTPIAIVPNGVELPAASPPRVERAERTLLFLARLHKKKGIRELIDAWKIVSKTAPDWRLVVAGPDEQGMLASLKLAARGTRTEFVGPVFDDAKRALFEQADAFVLPSYSEGFPMAVLEAWSYALPVVKTTACNIPEGFRAGAALEVAPTVPSLIRTLGTLVATPYQELRTMGDRGRRLVDSRYSWDRVAVELESVYAWLRRERDRPSVVHLS